ncbi:MAG: hypothetical protein HFI52_08895 [Lachnospiraceae bacterium]|nr:hypothetical protein [Lachnospiraceae bacterium]
MGSLSYYLPVIIILVVIGAVIVFGISFIREYVRIKKDGSTCMYCKAEAAKALPRTYLFLLPVSFGDTYENAEKYLLTHMTPIMGREQIPSGRRACKVEVHSCSKCSKKQVIIEDFLLVRGEDYLKEYYKFAYEKFRPLLDAWEEAEQRVHPGF